MGDDWTHWILIYVIGFILLIMVVAAFLFDTRKSFTTKKRQEQYEHQHDYWLRPGNSTDLVMYAGVCSRLAARVAAAKRRV
jgi:hypothetical protein